MKWKVGCLGVMGLIGIGLGIMVTRLKWIPRPDFDVLGIAWLFMNLPNLLIWGLLLFTVGGTIVIAFQLRRLR